MRRVRSKGWVQSNVEPLEAQNKLPGKLEELSVNYNLYTMVNREGVKDNNPLSLEGGGVKSKKHTNDPPTSEMIFRAIEQSSSQQTKK